MDKAKDVETVECALCGETVPLSESYSPRDDAICAECMAEVEAEGGVVLDDEWASCDKCGRDVEASSLTAVSYGPAPCPGGIDAQELCSSCCRDLDRA